MRQVQKKKGVITRAYRLGDYHPMIEKLKKSGAIQQVDNSHWRVFSHEAQKGEVAVAGDYIKLDSSGTPYPNAESFFRENHRHVGGDDYEQILRRLYAWKAEDGMCQEIEFLIKHKGLVIDESNEETYFSAPLWGDILFAAKDAVIIFYKIISNAEGRVMDIDFNFVAREEFDLTYEVIGEEICGYEKRKSFL